MINGIHWGLPALPRSLAANRKILRMLSVIFGIIAKKTVAIIGKTRKNGFGEFKIGFPNPVTSSIFITQMTRIIRIYADFFYFLSLTIALKGHKGAVFSKVSFVPLVRKNRELHILLPKIVFNFFSTRNTPGCLQVPKFARRYTVNGDKLYFFVSMARESCALSSNDALSHCALIPLFLVTKKDIRAQ